MSAGILTTLQRTLPTRSFERPRVGQGSSLSFTVSARADRVRLFHVLTDAEYMEAWLSLPGERLNESVAVTSSEAGFRFANRSGIGSLCTVNGQYRLRRRSKLLIGWDRADVHGNSSSIVSIKLHGDFARTILCLAHFGLENMKERRWHEAFWQDSLKKLCALF